MGDKESLEQAKKLLAEERKARMETCQQAIYEVLQRYNCQLSALLRTSMGDLNVPIAITARNESNDF